MVTTPPWRSISGLAATVYQEKKLAATSRNRSPPVARQLPPSSLSDRKISTPAKATATPPICALCSFSSPMKRRISSVKMGPQARISELENAVDQWMP